MLRLSNVPLQFALSDSLWLSLAHSGSLWLTLALSGAHQLTRSLLGSPRHGRVATVFPSLLYDHVVHCCTMSLTSYFIGCWDSGWWKADGHWTRKRSSQLPTIWKPWTTPGLYLRRGEGAGGHFGREPRQSHISFKSTASWTPVISLSQVCKT